MGVRRRRPSARVCSDRLHRTSEHARCSAPSHRRGKSSHATAIGMIGGEHRLGRRLKFITENYVWHDGGIISLGVRFLGERLSADVGIFAPLVADTTFAAPVVNF